MTGAVSLGSKKLFLIAIVITFNILVGYIDLPPDLIVDQLLGYEIHFNGISQIVLSESRAPQGLSESPSYPYRVS